MMMMIPYLQTLPQWHKSVVRVGLVLSDGESVAGGAEFRQDLPGRVLIPASRLIAVPPARTRDLSGGQHLTQPLQPLPLLVGWTG